jgi:hypothetical protein
MGMVRCLRAQKVYVAAIAILGKIIFTEMRTRKLESWCRCTQIGPFGCISLEVNNLLALLQQSPQVNKHISGLELKQIIPKILSSKSYIK